MRVALMLRVLGHKPRHSFSSNPELDALKSLVPKPPKPQTPQTTNNASQVVVEQESVQARADDASRDRSREQVLRQLDRLQVRREA